MLMVINDSATYRIHLEQQVFNIFFLQFWKQTEEGSVWTHLI